MPAVGSDANGFALPLSTGYMFVRLCLREIAAYWRGRVAYLNLCVYPGARCWCALARVQLRVCNGVSLTVLYGDQNSDTLSSFRYYVRSGNYCVLVLRVDAVVHLEIE